MFDLRRRMQEEYRPIPPREFIRLGECEIGGTTRQGSRGLAGCFIRNLRKVIIGPQSGI